MKTGMEKIAFSGENARERARAEFDRLRRDGYKGVVRYTDQIDKKMVYVVAYPASEEQKSVLAAADKLLSSSTDVPLLSKS
jgi:hypothetical protein